MMNFAALGGDVFNSQFSTATFAAIAGLIVGSAIKLIDKFFNKEKEKLDMHVTLRKELREELDTVKEELYHLQSELDEWKQKYFDQVQLTNELKLAIIQLNDELQEYKRLAGIPTTRFLDDDKDNDSI